MASVAVGLTVFVWCASSEILILDWHLQWYFQVQGSDLREVCNKLIPDSIGKDIEKACAYIYPLQDVYIRKVKILKKPKFEVGRLMEMHGDISSYTNAEGEKVDRPDDYEPPVQESVWVVESMQMSRCFVWAKAVIKVLFDKSVTFGIVAVYVGWSC